MTQFLQLPLLKPTQKSQHLTGLTGGGLAMYLLALARGSSCLLAVVPDDQADQLCDDVGALASLEGPVPTIVFPAQDSSERLSALHAMAQGKVRLIISSGQALESLTFSREAFGAACRKIGLRQSLQRSSWLEYLESVGYERVPFVEDVGQYAIRGQVMDLFPPLGVHPLRIVFEGNQVEYLKHFAILDQQSIDFLEEAWIIPAKEEKMVSLQKFLSPQTPVFSFANEYPQKAQWVYDPKVNRGAVDGGFLPVPDFRGNIKLFLKHQEQWHNEGFRVMVFSHNQGEQERLQDLLHLDAEPEWRIGALARGFVHKALKLVVVTNSELFGRVRPRVRFPRFKGSGALTRYQELKSGDYVVHEKYGIARYKGLDRITILGEEADYLTLEYKGNDRLYVPLTDFRKVERYIGAQGKQPRLYSLDSVVWERLKKRVHQGVQDLAKDLLSLAAVRSSQKGHAFPEDSHMEEEFAASFIYEETPDQTKAIAEVKADMQSSLCMDRVVLGDVGYGKTEVAMRAAFKAVLDSKQVVMMVPTTILAEQHYNNFKERFADYPVQVGMLSRFQSKKEQKETLHRLQKGDIDIVIGTHRLLQKDVLFRDLGLLVIDEEHRFGVAQKERLKSLKKSVDSLVLSATPIPRTLQSSLSGIRALSLIETPPIGREPITTEVGPWDPDVAKAAISAELNRGGQVFYVYNIVKTILTKKRMLSDLIPGIRIGVAHGQMPAAALEEVMWKFHHKEYDVLLASTIIESGLDIPNVNTLVIEGAENLGLAQLYQLRGRVGRQRQQAYCYLFFSSDGSLDETSAKRMEAIREFTALGSGFQLALRDLEIRGSGNILGSEQHGFIHEVGFEMYTKLLGQAVEQLQGKPKPHQEILPTIQLTYPVYIPEEYLPTDNERITFYKRLLMAQESDLTSLYQELSDRCGKPPPPVENLFGVTRLRLLAKQYGMEQIVQDARGFYIQFSSEAKLSGELVARLLQKYPNILEFLPQNSRGLRLKKACVSSIDDLLKYLRDFLSTFKPI